MLRGADSETMIAAFIVLAVMLLVAFPIHEFAHALIAYRLGDSTARLFGRLTLDPRAHFDPFGGAMLAISMLLFTSGFGWAKPTPVNPRNLRGGQWGEAAVAAAGPISNLILAIAASIPLRFILATGMDVGIMQTVLVLFVVVNLLLMIFNLIPIPPLDGSKVLYAFLSPETAWRVRPVLEQYGTYIFLIAVFFPIFGGRTLFSVIIDILLPPLVGLLVGI